MITRGGLGPESRRIDEAGTVTGRAGTTTTTSAMRARRVMEVERMALVNHCVDRNPKLAQFVEAEGFEIVGSYGMCGAPRSTRRIAGEASHRLGRNAFREASGRLDDLHQGLRAKIDVLHAVGAYAGVEGSWGGRSRRQRVQAALVTSARRTDGRGAVGFGPSVPAVHL
jgi:hypothetical protein